jgi:hypothetical protein
VLVHFLESSRALRCISMKRHIMKKINLVAASLFLVLLSTGCDWRGIRGNGRIKTETRPVTAFTRVDAGGFYKLEWHPGPPSLSLTTDENLLPRIRSGMQGDLLKITMHDSIAPTHGIKIVITSPSLTGAVLSGALNFNAAEVNGGTFALQSGGAAKVTMAGKVNRLLADLTGASNLHAADLSAEDVELSVTGAGRADVTATNLLRAVITGAGHVSYGGNPKSVERKITGVGKIEPRD